MKKTIAVLAGDGIGPEIMQRGVGVLHAVAKKYRHTFNFTPALVGGAAYDETGHPLPKSTLDTCDAADAIYFGAIGGPKWADLPAELTPEKGALLALRKKYDLFANLRPAQIFEPLAGAASLKRDRLRGGLDILTVRELTGGIYFGNDKAKLILPSGPEKWAGDAMVYSVPEIERITKVACEAAMERDKRVTSVDKANVLESSKLWRKTVTDYVTKEFPEIALEHMYVDNAAMQLGTNPKQFDVIVTGNMFGDILSDLASAITGSIGMLPSASLNNDGFGLYEPVHGSAPDIAGTGEANPLAQILSGAMMLRHSFGMVEEAGTIESAVNQVLKEGWRTKDIATDGSSQDKLLTTAGMGNKVVKAILA
jgi:3-isopropylmalate dehydrogenase